MHEFCQSQREGIFSQMKGDIKSLPFSLTLAFNYAMCLVKTPGSTIKFYHRKLFHLHVGSMSGKFMQQGMHFPLALFIMLVNISF